MLAPVIDRTFDLTAILREPVEATWATLPQSQQIMLTQAFRLCTVATYVHSFDKFDGQQFLVLPNTQAAGTQQVVQTRIVPKSGDGHELNYVMREVGDVWRAADVPAGGSSSRVAVQRSNFQRLLTRGSSQGLLDSLRSKAADLSDGLS